MKLFVGFKGSTLFACLIIICSLSEGYGDNEEENTPDMIEKTANEEGKRLNVHDEIMEELNAESIKKYLKYLTSMPSTAGLPEAKIQAEWTKDQWEDFGFDKVKNYKYNVLLSLPEKPGEITMFNNKGNKVYEFEIDREPLLNGDPKDPRTVLPFNAYSAKGTVEGPLVYVNYGEEGDFQFLEDIGIDVAGCICLMRYSKVSRSQKVERAQNRGAVGAILYSDPIDWSPFKQFYPKGFELPGTGLQIGTIVREQGDLLSKEYPSKDGYFRLPIDKVKNLPKIPSQPISFNKAKKLLDKMDGYPGPKEWQGDFDFRYNVNGTQRVRLSVYTELVSKPTYSVCGTIHGNVEPDRMVILGNHRDSWNFGAADATSGSAALMEISRGLGKMLKMGWRPRRTIMVCSWDAEEFGLMGSAEWVEDHAKMIQQRAIAYLNVDIAVEGNYTVRFKTTPQMKDAFFEVVKKIPAPDNKRSLYEDWTEKLPSIANPGEPNVTVVQSGSDYKPFLQTIGVPCLDIRYLYDKLKMTADQYSAYHSIHDNFHLMSTWIDPGYKHHLAVAQMWAKMGLLLADSELIPFNLQAYAKMILNYAKVFKESNTELIKGQGISFDLLIEKIEDLVEATEEFHARLEKMDLSDPLKLRMANDQLMYFERIFIHETGHHGNKRVRHVILGTTAFYLRKSKFPTLKEAIYRAVKGIDPDWNGVKSHLSIVMSKIDEAIRHVQDVNKV
eukprot:gene15727-17312_t